MKQETKIRIVLANKIAKTNDGIWCGYFIYWALEKKYGFVCLKYKNDKIIGKCAFQYEPNEEYLFNEKVLENYGALLGVKNLLPYEEFLEDMYNAFLEENIEFMKWFNLKLLINSKILNGSDYCSTLTTKQDRLPNSGIVIDNYDYLISLYDDLFKDKEQLRLDLYD